MLDIGSTPTLSLVDTEGRPVTVAPVEGGTGVFIYFMRAVSCAQCNAAVVKLGQQRATFDEAGVRILVAVPEDAGTASAWKAKKKVPFDVVVGQEGTAHAEVGLMRKVFGMLQQSGNVLLDDQGVVRYAHASTNPGRSYDGDEVAEAVSLLTRPPVAG